MNLDYAVERLYQVGWNPSSEGISLDLERLPDGRSFPSVSSVQSEFSRAGLELNIKPNSAFHCVRATWSPVSRSAAAASGSSLPEHARQGTVVASCEREAAVYALATLRAAQSEAPLALA
jgi:hypothetical protein